MAVSTDDIVHDALGFPGSPRSGKEAVGEFYCFLTAKSRTETEEPLHRFFDGDTMVLEQTMTGTVIVEMLGLPGRGRRVASGILHVFAFHGGLICREQVRIDSGSVVAQLTAD